MKDLKFGGAPNQAQQSRNEPEIHRSRQARSFERRQVPEEIRMCLKWSKLINTFLPFPFCPFSSAAHTFSPELAAKGKDPKLKCITEVARKVWNELDEGPPQTEIERSLKVESCKIEMPHLMSMHNWMWNVGHCRCWGSLKRLLYHLPFLGIWQIIPSNSILSSLSSFPDCPRINHLHQKLAKGPWQEGLPPSVVKTTRANIGSIGNIPIFEIARTLMNATKDLNLRDSAVRRLSKTTWNKYKKLKTIENVTWKKHENTYENRIWAGRYFWRSNQPNQSDESQPKKGDFAAKLLEVVPDPSRREPAPAVFLQILLPHFPTNAPGS